MGRTEQAESSASKAMAVETEAKTAEDVSSERRGGSERSEYPKAPIPMQTDGDSSSEESSEPVGSDDATVVIRTLREISKTHFTGKRARGALRKEKDFFYQWRQTVADRPQGAEYPEDLLEEIEAYVGAAKGTYVKA
eukprot:1270854-Pyramimonas_sp.AAC.1